MRRFSIPAVTAVLGVGVALGVGACGEDRGGVKIEGAGTGTAGTGTATAPETVGTDTMAPSTVDDATTDTTP